MIDAASGVGSGRSCDSVISTGLIVPPYPVHVRRVG
jgi:hypothetical protein